MATGNLQTDILVLVLPIVLAVVMGILGVLRGSRREAVVSLSLIIAALIISIWGGPWSTDLHDAFTGLTQPDIQTWLGIILLVLMSLVIGYGLGSALVPHTRLTALSRLGGLIIGLANGTALSGWILRNYYNSILTDPSGANTDMLNTLTTNTVSRALIIWAGWFPLLVALAAAIVALVGPFRRARTVVATPSSQTDWQPATAPAVASTTNAPLPASTYPQQYTQQYPQQQYAQQYPPQFGAQPQPPQSAQSPYSQSSFRPTPPTTPVASPPLPPAARVDDAPPTMPMPRGESPLSGAGQDTRYIPTTPPISGALSSTPSPTTSTPPTPATSSAARGVPNTGPLGEPPDEGKANIPAWAQPPDSSWLSAPRASSDSSTAAPPDSSAVDRSEAPTLAYPVSIGTGSPASSAANCPRCGATVPADATFCTECGNQLKS